MERLADESRHAGILIATDGERITSVDGLRREWSIVEDARRMRCQHRPFARNFDLSSTALDEEQQRAVAHLLHSRDGVTLFRGAAGTGKTFALREFVSRLKAAGHPVQIAAPQAQQARTLTAHGLPAVTLSMLLHQDELPIGAVVIVDEAGQVGGRQMEQLFGLAHRFAARLVLSGDTRQHASVEASDAMRSLEAYSHVRIAQIGFIRRQDPRLGRTPEERLQIAEYRRAVEEASQGQPESALARLHLAGFVHETPDVVGLAAEEYTKLSAEGMSVLAISQTRETVRQLNEAIAKRLIARGDVRDPRPLETFVPRDVPAAEKQLPETYTPGMRLHLHRGYSTLERGDVVTVDGIDGGTLILLTGSGLPRRIPLKYSDYWEILERHTITAGPGSILQLRANGTSRDGHKFYNGELVTLEALAPDGTLRVRDSHHLEKNLWPDQRLLQSGYAVTSYGSQGKSVDAVLLADAGVATATHRKEWYVSISRARRRIAVFTPDLSGLASRIAASGDRMLGLELLPEVREFVGIGTQAVIQQAVSRAHRVMHQLKARIS